MTHLLSLSRGSIFGFRVPVLTFQYCYKFGNVHAVRMGRDSSVGIANRYGLDGPGIESRWGGARHSASVQTGPWAYPAFCTIVTGSFQGGKWPGRGVYHPPLSSTEVKERVELYLYYPYGRPWPVLVLNLPLPVHAVPFSSVPLNTGLSIGESGRGVAFTTHPYLAPRLKKE
jgi:hypothetical protein